MWKKRRGPVIVLVMTIELPVPGRHNACNATGAAALALELGVGFVPIRKKGKLPFTTVEETYELEYGSATVEMHTDAVRPGDRVLLIDDLIATGGTMMAGKKLLERMGAQVIEGAAIVDLPELGGSRKLREAGLKLFTLVDFGGH
jgi:adenine phosphoribosyltransferase